MTGEKKSMRKKLSKKAADIERRVSELRRYNAAYRAGETLIADAEYDDLIEELRNLDPTNPWLEQVEPESLSGSRVKHGSPMLSTEKAYTRDKLEDWIKRIEKAAAEIGLAEVEFKVTPKLDGLAGLDTGGIFATRGNGRIGTDITHVFERGVVPVGGRNQGAGEVVILQSWFEAHALDEFDHPRNMCVGIINADEVSATGQEALDAGAVRFVPYTGLPTRRGDRTDLLERIGEFSDELREEVEYALDGMVAEATDSALKKHMGATSHHHRWQIAIKERGETTTTTVQEIVWQTGRTGNRHPGASGGAGGTQRGDYQPRDGPSWGHGARVGVGCRRENPDHPLGRGHPQAGRSLGRRPRRSCCPRSVPRVAPNSRGSANSSTAPTAPDVPPRSRAVCAIGSRSWEPPTTGARRRSARVVAAGYVTLEQLYALTEAEILEMDFGKGQTKNLLEALEDQPEPPGRGRAFPGCPSASRISVSATAASYWRLSRSRPWSR